ncbi:MAG TPA: hypothetical protein PLL77_15650 [Pyrinomonadaceae bacterium]|nr:hypothetical protein [Pyrinomonadaceae bacterium]
MRGKRKPSPVEQRKGQIEKQMETLKSPKNQKTIRDFKTPERFEEWTAVHDRKLRDLEEELCLLDDAGDYFEVPLGLAALELGVTLEEMVNIVSEGIIETSFVSDYRAGHRISRDELARAIELGTDELLRLANKTPQEIFTDAIEFIRLGDVTSVEACQSRLERLNYADPYWAVLDTMVLFMRREYEGVFRELSVGLEFLDRERDTGPMSALDALRQAMAAIEPPDHIARVIKERILAVAEGKKLKPYDQTYSGYQATEFPSRMNDNQRRAMFIATVVMEAIDKYRLNKWIKRGNGFMSEADSTEFERVVRNAIYTALEAEASYDHSPSSQFFVDRFTDLLPKRWVPAEVITFLPKNEES